ncbi:MAG: homoserine O-succinyltransferase MetX [Aequoribacter sp.]|jgi:homoserine O-acetyltransferase|uniref:homoserine O-succinyltransferase MetX n=2 Tax=Aequoribacter sp. TaxID=2847771 RepID=UPI003C4CE428
MSEPNSVGIVSPQTAHFDAPLALACGKTLNEFDLVYETYGELNAQRTNAILICHALSGHHHAAGYHSESETKPGWWDTCIGPGKPIDTNVYFVVSLNNLGGCHGSTGPTSINSETGKLWGPDFPQVRVSDWVNSQAALADHLGIDIWAAVIGGSLGGMQAMQWSVQYPERLRYCLIIASAMDLSAQNIAFNEIARQAIQSDPNFCAGHYRERETNPSQGLALARMVGHVTYLSDDAMANKFGRDIRSGSIEHNIDQEVEFQVESYLRYQGSQFSTAFDANTYILMTRALDYFDIAADFNGDPVKAFATTKAQFLVVSFSTDWRFSPRRSREITNALIAANRPVSYAEIEAAEGHDAFLMPIPRYLDVLRAYLGRIAEDLL